MSNRITQANVEAAAQALKRKRLAEGKDTWLVVHYANGFCNLAEVDAETAARHCHLRHITGGTKREMYNWLRAAMY